MICPTLWRGSGAWRLSVVADTPQICQESRLHQYPIHSQTIIFPGCVWYHFQFFFPSSQNSLSSFLFFSVKLITCLPCTACLWCTRRPPPPPGRSSARPWTGRESSVWTPWQCWWWWCQCVTWPCHTSHCTLAQSGTDWRLSAHSSWTGPGGWGYPGACALSASNHHVTYVGSIYIIT